MLVFLVLAKCQIVQKTGLTRICILSRNHWDILLVFEILDKALHLLNSVLQLSNLQLALFIPGPHLVQNRLEAVVSQAYCFRLTTLSAEDRIAGHL